MIGKSVCLQSFFFFQSDKLSTLLRVISNPGEFCFFFFSLPVLKVNYKYIVHSPVLMK